MLLWGLGGLLLAVVALVAVAAALDDAPPADVSRPRVTMPDGVRLAVDVILPTPRPARVPVVLLQTRYWRSFAFVFPDAPGKVPKGPREPIVEALVRAGYGVVVADVRGTGASEGRWAHPFGPQEVEDSRALLEWVAAQPWCDGRLGATGLSYEGTTALAAAATGHPALKAVLAREVEWDLVDELLAPGGVRNLSFPEAWGRAVQALDRGAPPDFLPAAAKWVVRTVHPTDDDVDGRALESLLAGREVVDVAAALEAVRGPSDSFGAGPPVGTLGPSAWAEALRKSPAAIAVWGGWWDGATGDAVLRADEALSLREAVIGPWAHDGTETASPFGGTREATVALDDVVRFFDVHLRGAGAGPPVRRWWVSGAERWTSAARWPQTHLVTRTLLPAGEAVLDVDFGASTGVKNRWMTGLVQPVVHGDRARARGLQSFTLPAREAPLRFFGAPRVGCEVALDGDEAALHVYLEEVMADGVVRLLTEGVQRVRGGRVTVPLRALAAELPVGGRLRVSIAGADAPTFERVPPAGPRRLTLRGAEASPCQLELPELVTGA